MMLVHYGVRRTNGKSISQDCGQVKTRNASHVLFSEQRKLWEVVGFDSLTACGCRAMVLLSSSQEFVYGMSNQRRDGRQGLPGQYRQRPSLPFGKPNNRSLHAPIVP
jgi:hypothetical protein